MEESVRYWCVSTSHGNWKVCREKRLWGLDARYFVTLEKFLKPGDKAIVYSSKKFVAVIQFATGYCHSEEDLGWTKGNKKFLFPYRIGFEMIHESNDPPTISYSTEMTGSKARWSKPNLIDQITFIADKGKTWNQYLQVSIIRITEEDFETVSSAVMRS